MNSAKLLILILSFTALFSCGSSNENTTESKEVNVLIWEGIIAPDVIPKFEQETGLKVNVGYYESNEELLSKLQAGAAGIDLIFPSDYMIEIMIRQNLLSQLELANLPNAAGIDSTYLGLYFDSKNQYSIPYQISTAGIAINTDEVNNYEESWSLLWDENYAGKLSMLDDMRYGVIPAQKLLGYSANTQNQEELDKTLELLIDQRKLSNPIYSSYSYSNYFKTKEIVMGYVYSGDAFQIAKEVPSLQYFIPKEGTNVAIEAMCIPKKSKNKLNAEKLINFILKPEIHAAISNYTFFANPNKASLPFVDDEIKNNPYIYLSPEVWSRCEFIQDLGGNNSLYEEIWNKVKLAN